MTQLQYLPELLLAVLFSIQASFTHPGVLSPDKEKLGDDELRAIVKRTQTSSEAREVLAFSARVWAAMTETLRSGCDELSGCEHHFDSQSPNAAGASNGGVPVVSAAAMSAAGVGAGVGTSAAGAAAGAAAAAANGGGSNGTTGRKANGVGEQTCTCKDRRDKMYLLPKVWELVILGRNLLATKEKGQDLAAESKFEEEVRRLCEICVKHAEKESYHKVLITCLQFLNNLISGNEKRKMSLWMHLFVPGSTRLLEAAKRKAVKQYQTNPKDPSSSPSSADSKKKSPADLISFAKDIHQEMLKTPQAATPGSQAKLSFVTMLPTILSAKEMLPLLLIIHGSITDIDGTDPARQLMRCKMMLAAEAGIGLMAGLLMFVDAWHEIDDHIYFELILEIMETILHNGLITYLFETLKEYVDCRNYQFEGVHAITPPQAVILRLLHTIYAPAALPTISEPGAYINYDGRIEDSVKYPPPPGLLPPIVPGEYGLPSPSKIIHGYKPAGHDTPSAVPAPPDDDVDPFTAEFTAALRSDLGPVGDEAGAGKDKNHTKADGEPAEDDAATEVDIDHSEATPEIVNFLAVKVLKGQLGPAVRDMVTRIGRATGYCAGSPFSFDTSSIAPTIPPPPVAPGKQQKAGTATTAATPATPATATTATPTATPADPTLEVKQIPCEDGRTVTSVAGITIYDVELHYEGLIQLLELLMLFAEQNMGRVYLRETRCIDELVALLQTIEMFVPRTTPKERASGKRSVFHSAPYVLTPLASSNNANGGGAEEEDAGMECNDPAEFRWPLIKRTIVQIIGLLAYRNKETQDQIRKNGGLIAIISCFNIDEENPYIPQHATLTVRNLLEANAENQRIVWTLEAREVMNTRDLEKAGLQAYVDKQGKVKVGAAPGSQGPVQAAATAAASSSNGGGSGSAAGGGNSGGGGGSKKKKKGKK
ncbi:copper transport protein [Orbilia brochopaga]|uniref:Ataxin-10 homolog n=1 Tax=Orbilia brochopaga TaxID=3140254 RepID=A0AAV9UPH4_9PEZI